MYLSTVLVLLFTFGTSLIGLVSSDAVSYCEDVEFYQKDYSCCGNKLKPRLMNSRCCEDTGEVYNAATQVCCGTVEDVARPSSVDCCRKGGKATLYDTSRQQCCLDTIHDTKRDLVLDTGRSLTIDIMGFCCGSDYIELNGTDDGRWMTCCPHPDYPALSRPHDMLDTVCCAGRVLPKPSTGLGLCCGQQTYDQYDQVCCNVKGRDTVLPAIGNGINECCANAPAGVIDRGSHVCVDDHPYKRDSVACNRSSNTTLGCCAGYLGYNKTTHHCCGGARVLPLSTVCCAGQPVLEGQVCCGPDHGAVTVSDPADHNACCFTATSYTTYKNTTHTCHHGEVQQRFMCGERLYNPTKKLCCEGELYPKYTGYLCCGKRIYTPKYLTCCNGQRIHGANRPCQ